MTPDLVEYGPFLRRTAGVLGLDFRGHGGSDDGPTTFGLLEVEDVAGALAWLGERGIRRVALVGSSMGGITAIAAVAVLGDGRLAAADRDIRRPGGHRGRAATADLRRRRRFGGAGARGRGRRAGCGLPFGRRIADHAVRADGAARRRRSRATPSRSASSGCSRTCRCCSSTARPTRPCRPKDAQRLAAAAPAGSRHLVIEGADHGRGHAVDPARYEAEVTSLIRGALRTRPPVRARRVPDLYCGRRAPRGTGRSPAGGGGIP